MGWPAPGLLLCRRTHLRRRRDPAAGDLPVITSQPERRPVSSQPTKASGSKSSRPAAVDMQTLCQLLHPRNVPTGQPHGFTWDQALDRVSHINAPATRWREVAVYLTLQYLGLHQHDSSSERWALTKIRSALASLDESIANRREASAQSGQLDESGPVWNPDASKWENR